MLAQMGVNRFHAGLGEQRVEHHVLAAAFREMLATGLAQRADACVAVLIIDATSFSRCRPSKPFLAI
jgi:hypothetical protein